MRRLRGGGNIKKTSVLVGVLLSLSFSPLRCWGYSVSSPQQRLSRPYLSKFCSTSVAQENREDSESSIVVNDLRDDGMPPWLSVHQHAQEETLEKQLEHLEFSLFEHGFSPWDIQLITLTMKESSRGDRSILSGMVKFLGIVLTLEQRMSATKHVFVTIEVMLASVLHYVDCVGARRSGMHELVKDAVHSETEISPLVSESSSRIRKRVNMKYLESLEVGNDHKEKTSSLVISSSNRAKTGNTDASPARLSEEVIRLSQSAARVKGAEIMATAVLGERSFQTEEEAAKFRGLLLSVMDDWRALGIRVVACLFRLEGILKERNGVSEFVTRTPEMVQTARKALHVYSPLAQRLGMQKLKDKLEDSAFSILYTRQYETVSSLYQSSGASLKAMSRYLESQITQLLAGNVQLMSDLESLQITSRVKAPFSTWKKLLRGRVKDMGTLPLVSSAPRGLQTIIDEEVSLVDVKDVVALRVVIKARKLTEDEPEETTRARERVLCYVVHRFIRNQWPVMDPLRVKDYIMYPKPNGYQSLHYSSYIPSQGVDWPFEVQVRSEEMHQAAEYGNAAHWEYKLRTKRAALQPQKGLPQGTGSLTRFGRAPLPALPSRDVANGYIDALHSAKQDLVQQKVYVFLVGTDSISGKGQLLTLPGGARISDALAQLGDCLDENERVIDNPSEVRVLRNGLAARTDDFLSNGDVLLVKKDDLIRS